MARYLYEDFRVTFTPRTDGAYDVVALESSGIETAGRFDPPLTDDELRAAVLGVIETTRARAGTRKAAPGRAARDVGDGSPPAFDSERLGGALASALLSGPVGAAYDRASAAARSRDQGIRLTLSLAGAPALLSVPWEFVYRRPRFLASQRRTPLVRLLDTGASIDAPTIQSTVRILGVIASPNDLNPLDVDAERRRVQLALQKVCDLGRVELDWLEPATPRKLRQALRDGQYHVLHYVGHSDFTAEGDGVLFLEDASGGASAKVDSTALANLLSDQNSLRLVVLNSCEGARTTLTDPYAGVATTLVQLGVPAVVAMQFEISDEAAICFAEELYTNLIGRQDPIDAAVAEARKAIFIEVDDRVEWATPVLFLRDPDVELFHFEVPRAPLPPLPAPTSSTTPLAPPDGGGDGGDGGTIVDSPAGVPRRRAALALAAVGAIAVASVLVIRAVIDEDAAPTTTAAPPTTVAPSTTLTPGALQPTTSAVRPRTGFLAAQVAEPGGEIHLYTIDPADFDGEPGGATTATGVVDSQPVWDRNSNRLAFTRWQMGSPDVGVFYVVPGDNDGDRGKRVAPLIVDDNDDDSTQRLPAWGDNGVLFYVATSGCPPGPGCAEEVHRATFSVSDEPTEGTSSRYLDTRSLDTLTVDSDTVVASSFATIRAVAADPSSDERVAVVDDDGLWIVTGAVAELVQPGLDASAMTFTPSGTALVIATAGDDAATAGVAMFAPDGAQLFGASIAQLDDAAADFQLPDGPIVSLTPGELGGEVGALVDRVVGGDAEPPVFAGIDTSGDGLALIGVTAIPGVVNALGEVQAIAL